MRTKVSTYFESKVRLEKINEEGMQVKFNEVYTIEACSFTDCEAKMNEYISQYTQGEFNILTEAYAKYKEIFFSDKEDETLWYKAQISFITIDEKTEKQKKSKTVYLVQGKDIESAKKNIDEVMSGSMVDYVIEGIHETTIQDIICDASKTQD